MKRKPMGDAVEELKANLDTVARVYEWARLMGYKNPKLFGRHFIRRFRSRPSEMLKQIRLRSIISTLRRNNKPCAEVAWKHSLPDEKALNNYTNRHAGYSPSQIREMSDQEIQALLKGKFGE